MYDSLARDYDRFNNWANRLAAELPFIESEIAGLKIVGQSNVLDAACGTGMHAIALARHGMTCSGADLSPRMVAQARNNARHAHQKVDFRVAGFGNLANVFLHQRYDVLLCLGNSLPHVLTENDLAAALSDFAACLSPGGLLLIQSRNFDAVLARRDRFMPPETYSDPDHEWLFQRFYDFEPGGLIRFNMVRLKRRRDAEWHARVVSTLLYPQTQALVNNALIRAGFVTISCYGSMGGDPFDPRSSGNLVVSAHKASPGQ